jgi:hypothetical protein
VLYVTPPRRSIDPFKRMVNDLQEKLTEMRPFLQKAAR